MQKVILDTNVVVSALIQKSFPFLILQDLYLERKIELCISEKLMTEYLEVLNREKFNKFPDFKVKAETILVDIANNATFFKPKKKVKKLRDIDDNMVLELASAAKADYIVTGNTRDFTLSKFKKTLIVSPMAYWATYKPD